MSANPEALDASLHAQLRAVCGRVHGGASGLDPTGHEPRLTQHSTAADVPATDEALHEQNAVDPCAAEIAKRRIFNRLPVAEVAESIAVSSRAMRRAWPFARPSWDDRPSAP